MIGAAISALGGLASTALGLANASEQRSYDYQMWLKQQEYNKPVNQVKRLREAGLNPALALNQITTGTADSHAGGQEPYDFSPLQQGLSAAGTLMSQRDLVQAQAKEHSANADLQAYNVAMADAREKRSIETYILDLEERKARIRESAKSNEFKDAQIRSIDSQIESSNAQLEFFNKSFDERLRSIKLQNTATEQSISLQEAQETFVREQQKWYGKLSKSQIDSAYQNIALVQQEVKNLVIDGKLKNVQAAKTFVEKRLTELMRQDKLMDVNDKSVKLGVRNATPGTKTLYHFTNYVGDCLVNPLRGLFK